MHVFIAADEVVTQKVTPLPPVCATGAAARWARRFLSVLTVDVAPASSPVFFHSPRAPCHLFLSSEERAYYICSHHATISRSLDTRLFSYYNHTKN